jgi:hypothetical protein
MGLVYRNGRPYLYRSIRRNGRVTSQYLAGGEDALLIDRLGRMERDERDADLQAKQSERKQSDDLKRALDVLAEQARDLARDALTAAGYHQHHRGKWRKRRVDRRCEAKAGRENDGQMGRRQAH